MDPPKGFYDICGDEVKKQRLVEAVFVQQGYERGYEELKTPVIEPATSLLKDSFNVEGYEGFFGFELLDYDEDYKQVGSTRVVLRPEGTIPVCRFLARQLLQGKQVIPIKLLYSISCYRNEPIEDVDGYKRREFSQLGVENIGDNNIDADLEVIEYGYSVLRKLGVPKDCVRIRVSDISLFNQLCEDSELTEEEKVRTQNSLDRFSKNRALGKIASPYFPFVDSLPTTLQKRWEDFVFSYGQPQAYQSKLTPQLAELVLLADKIDLPLKLDMSVVRGFSYYTGSVFQFDVTDQKGNWQAEVGGGGRYDNLIGQNLKILGIDKQVPATGFAFGTERLVAASRLPKGKYNVEMVI